MTSSRGRAERPRRADEKRGQRSSGRYTPPSRKHIRIRPRWHQLVGGFLVVVGLVMAALNGLMYMGDDLRLLPGGFSVLYVLAGLPVAAAGAWFLGLFDEGQTTYR